MHAESGVIDVTRLRVALARLSRRLRRHSLAGLTPTQLAALSTVEQSGPLRLGDLAAAEGIAPSTLTRMVAVLEDLGYVRRDADPRDARASTLAITAKGHETLERLRAEGTALLTQWLAMLTLEQRAALATALPALEALAEPQRPRLLHGGQGRELRGGQPGECVPAQPPGQPGERDPQPRNVDHAGFGGHTANAASRRAYRGIPRHA